MQSSVIHKRALITIAAGITLSGCLPKYLQKYSRAENVQDSTDNGVTPMPGDRNSEMAGDSRKSNRSQSVAKTRTSTPRASIYAIDKRTYRFLLREGDVWEGALNVLLRNYNLTIVDKQNGIITTEWDSFYFKNAVYRNKISLRLTRGSWNVIDVTIHNNVERLRDASQAGGMVGAIWLPAEDEAQEVARIVQNMALLLNQPPPILPPGTAVAVDKSDSKEAAPLQ